jgi:chromosomal replication initiation ATPase DnaA
MKNNLEAKFRKKILLASQKEDNEIVDIEFMVDDNIDVPSNSKVIDCTKYYKEATKTIKTNKKSCVSNGPETTKRSVNERYTLDKFVV